MVNSSSIVNHPRQSTVHLSRKLASNLPQSVFIVQAVSGNTNFKTLARASTKESAPCLLVPQNYVYDRREGLGVWQVFYVIPFIETQRSLLVPKFVLFNTLVNVFSEQQEQFSMIHHVNDFSFCCGCHNVLPEYFVLAHSILPGVLLDLTSFGVVPKFELAR